MADNFAESLGKEILKKAIYDAVKFVLFIVFTYAFALLSSKLLAINVTAFEPYMYYIGILFGTALSFLAIVLYRHYDKHRPNFPRLEFDFKIIECEISYTYTDKTHMQYRKRKLIESLRNGFNTYKDKYRWTGRGEVSFKSGIPEQTVVPTVNRNVWSGYEIRLQKTLLRGESVPTEVVWDLEDSEKCSVPFISAMIDEPTNFLRLNLTIPPCLGVREVTCEISSSIGSEKVFKSDVLPLDKHGEVSWPVKDPKLLYHYEMKWFMPQE